MTKKIELKSAIEDKMTGKKGLDALLIPEETNNREKKVITDVVDNTTEKIVTVSTYKKYHKALKRIALDKDMKLLDVINDAIENYIANNGYNF